MMGGEWFIVGIDPGLSGGIAWLSGGNGRVCPMPTRERPMKTCDRRQIDLDAIRRLLDSWKERCRKSGDTVRVIVEEQGARPLDGPQHAFSTGRYFGRLEGLMYGLGIGFHIVRPQDWRRAMGLESPQRIKIERFPGEEDKPFNLRKSRESARVLALRKSASVDLAKRLHPELSFLPTAHCTKESDGMAEAVLLAEYGRKLLERSDAIQHSSAG